MAHLSGWSRTLLVLTLLVPTLTGCGSTQAHTTPPASLDPTVEWNRLARAGSAVDLLHGVEVQDPYRSLEVDSPETQAWINQQTERTTDALAPFESATANERIEELLGIGSLGSPRMGGDRIFYTKRDGDREQPAVYMMEPGSGQANAIIDPETFGERAALDWYFPSPHGRYVAFGISHNGDERSTLHVLDLESGERLDDRIPRTKWTGLSWLHDESGFYYRRYPNPGEEHYDAEHEDTSFPRIFFHGLGQDPATDTFVLGSDQGTDFPAVSVSDDDRWLVLTTWRGWSASDVLIFDRGEGTHRRIAPDADHPATPVMVGEDHITTATIVRGELFLMTNQGAPRYHIYRTAAADAANRESWREIIPQRAGPIEDWGVIGEHLVVHYVMDVRSQLQIFSLDGEERGAVQLPSHGSVSGLSGRSDGHHVAFGFGAALQPPAALRYDLNARSLEVIDEIACDIDFSRFQFTVEMVPSADGTEIPVQIIHRRDLERNGENRVLLTAYGGFNVALLPSFRRNALYWIERGHVYAVANLRGGSEYGETWHRAGNLENKERVFEDMEAVTRWFTSSQISAPQYIAITGGSNGGLLMGAMITRAPETFRATATYVGLYDMIRYHHFPPAELWISEYGSADEAEQFSYLHAYSPYHRVVPETDYPAVLVETADHDSRVFWGHSTKFAARLQEATASRLPVYFYMERQVGHGAGTRLSDTVRRYVRMYTFIESQLGLR